MSRNLVSLKVHETDKKRLLSECKEIFIKEHPELRGMKITQNFMFRKVVDFYIEQD